MSRDSQVMAVRTSAALSRPDWLSCVRVTGPAAFDSIDRVCAGEIFVREGQAMHTVLLGESAEVFADVYLCALADGYLLIADGPSPEALLGHLREHAAGPGLVLDELGASHALIGIDGPYAWELLAALAGPESVGLPFQSHFDSPEFLCLRAGKTGEFGYLLLSPGERAGAVIGELLDKGRRVDLAEAGQDALDQCALENAFFNVRREARPGLTPIELQLQWRASRRKEFVGSAALRARRAVATARTVWLRSAAPLMVGDEVRLGERRVGELLNTGSAPALGEHVALALVDLDVAHPGVDGLQVAGAGALARARTVSAPLIDNRSLYVDPQRHSYTTRAEVGFPPIA